MQLIRIGSIAMITGKFLWEEIWVRNTQGVYRLIQELRKRHPEVEYEACASGGGRVDYGAMRYFDEYWPSDNSDPLDRLYMQENYSYIYPIKYMRAWLTDDFGMNQRYIPLKFFSQVLHANIVLTRKSFLILEYGLRQEASGEIITVR